jgi:uncharacterized membrane protein YdjX (TVP38/TMEM64 family)
MRRGAALVVAALVVLGLAVAWSAGVRDVGIAAWRARIESAGTLAPLVFMGFFVGGFFVPIPQVVLVALGGAMFGVALGFVYSWTASVVGTWLVFAVVRRLLASFGDRGRVRLPATMDARLVAHGFTTVVALRLVLLLSPPLSWALALTRVRTRDFVLGTAVGIVPVVGVVSYFGDAVIAAESVSALLTPRIVVAGALVTTLLVAGTLGGRRLFGAAR